MSKRLETLLVIFAALLGGFVIELAPREPLLTLLRDPWPDWTWSVNITVRVGSQLLLVLGLFRYAKSGRRSLLVFMGLGFLLFTGFLEGITARIEAQPIRLGLLLEHLAVGCLGLEFARVRRRCKKPS